MSQQMSNQQVIFGAQTLDSVIAILSPIVASP
jgi:hypothetical protein